MKRHFLPLLALTMFAFALLFPSAVQADGIIIPQPPICDFGPCPGPTPITQLAIRYHRVNVTIENQIAVTRVDQVFFNPNDWAVEGIYMFPLPLDATVTNFSLWIDGQAVSGEVLDAEEARQIYEEIVRSMQDPALLEYIDRGAFKASIFPIPPRGERRIELEYTQALTSENGLVRYVYPLNTEKFSVWPLENVSISVDVRSQQPIRAMYSPTHSVGINRISDTHATAGYEDSNVKPDTDFALYYSIGESQAFHLLSYRDPSDLNNADGFFMLMLAPQPRVEQEALAKDVLLVLDKSGSMDGDKFRQSQEALRYILNSLNPGDRFNVISFSTGIEIFASRLQPASEASAAIRWVDQLSAIGSTDISRALLEAAAMADRERPTYVIFLTDGLPTEGITDSQMILDALEDAAPRNLRLFSFGVGYDVDTFLLDSLAQAHHGNSTYVLPAERLDEIISAFYAKISTPVLTDLELDFGDLPVYDLYPDPLPDLFSGSQIVVVGRYRSGGSGTVTLRGMVNQELQTFTFEEQNFTRDSRFRSGDTLETLPRLWATRKIGHLLNQVRLSGPDQETINQIVQLSIRYGIVTPYTSYLVTEPLPLGAIEQDRISADAMDEAQLAATAPSFGQAAVEKASTQGDLAEAEAPAELRGAAAEVIRNVGSRTFVYADGIWVDTTFDPEGMKTIQVAFLSDDYFDLVEAVPQLAAAFSLGEQVIALSDGIAYQVVSSGSSTLPVEIPTANNITPNTSPQDSGQPKGNTASEPDTGFAIPCLSSLLPLLFLPMVLVNWRRKR